MNVPDGFRLRDDHIDFFGSAEKGEHLQRLWLLDADDRPVAGIEYRTLLWNGTVHPPRLDMIMTKEGHRRRGYASLLLDNLAERFGYEKLVWTFQNEEMAAFRAAYEARRAARTEPAPSAPAP